jgi:hypothetical protein
VEEAHGVHNGDRISLWLYHNRLHGGPCVPWSVLRCCARANAHSQTACMETRRRYVPFARVVGDLCDRQLCRLCVARPSQHNTTREEMKARAHTHGTHASALLPRCHQRLLSWRSQRPCAWCTACWACSLRGTWPARECTRQELAVAGPRATTLPAPQVSSACARLSAVLK